MSSGANYGRSLAVPRTPPERKGFVRAWFSSRELYTYLTSLHRGGAGVVTAHAQSLLPNLVCSAHPWCGKRRLCLNTCSVYVRRLSKRAPRPSPAAGLLHVLHGDDGRRDPDGSRAHRQLLHLSAGQEGPGLALRLLHGAARRVRTLGPSSRCAFCVRRHSVPLALASGT